MPSSLAFILGLLYRADPAFASFEDFQGPHASALGVWQRMGFLAAEAEPHRVPSCPHCHDGVPVAIGGRVLCGRCLSGVDPRHLLAWRFDLEVFLSWLAGALKLQGDVRQLDDHLWQLGSLAERSGITECFFCRGPPTGSGSARLLAYRSALVLRALPTTDAIDGYHGPSLALLDILRQSERELTVGDLTQLLRGDGAVRFDVASGTLWAGDTWLGEVPVGGREFHLLACLAENLDRFVAYADLKHEVLRRSRNRDTTDEATFCHKLKRRIKEKWVPGIDRLIATTNKGDGYRLRGYVTP